LLRVRGVINFGKGGERMGVILFLLGLVFFFGGIFSGALLPMLIGLVFMVLSAKVLAIVVIVFVIVLIFLRRAGTF
jgi:hypothetical protein